MKERQGIEFECRYWTQDNNQRDWVWARHRETVCIDIPDKTGESYQFLLPPLFFTRNARWTWKLTLVGHGSGWSTMWLDEPNGSAFIRGLPFTQSRLWSQVTFHVPMWTTEHAAMRSPWWLRWRMPNADHDIMSVIKDGLDELDQWRGNTVTADIIQRLRREIVMNALGAPMPHRTQRSEWC